MKRLFVWILSFSIALSQGPVVFVGGFGGPDLAFAQGRVAPGARGGYSHRPASRPSGARTRPAARPAPRPSTRPATRPAPKPATRPSTKPVNRPSTKPVTRPSTQPVTRPSTQPVNRPSTRPVDRPGTRPPGSRPPGSRPPGARPPGSRPPGTRPPGYRPPGHRPPGYRPPGGRPPGWRPPGHRPPYWRPPAYRPPYYRPPHPHWGRYYWYPDWGWYFTALVAGATLVYVTSLPSDKSCQKVTENGETLYLCDGVLYRATYKDDQQVYEIVSDPEEEANAEPQTVIGLALTSPMTRGQVVRDLQNQLVAAGYDVGAVDGVFGSDTETAILWFQYDNGLEQTGYVDRDTAELLGFDVPPAAPSAEGDAATEPSSAEEGSEAAPSEATSD